MMDVNLMNHEHVSVTYKFKQRKIERLKKEHNEKEKQVPLRLPDLKIVITGTQYGYKREDGVLVIPIGSLKD